MRLSFSLLFIVVLSNKAFAQNYTVSGFIKDSSTGEVLIGANIYNANQKNGTATNNFGFFSYTTSSNSITFIVSYIGYKTEKLSYVLTSNIQTEIELTPGNLLDEVTVTAEENMESITQMSKITIPVHQIKLMPRLLGEVDVLKSIQILPGVQSGTEGTSGLYVRGGGPDQNLILLDGVPVYNVSHLFGFVSVFNADAINNVDLVKGGYPARYGGRLSSVLDISLKEGNRERVKAEGSLGIISSKLTIDGPIDDKTTFLISGRRTFADLIARPILRGSSSGEVDAGYYFYDLNAKINTKLSSKDRIYLSAYLGRDSGFGKSFKTDTTLIENENGKEVIKKESLDEYNLRWGNITSVLRWNHIFSPKLFGNLSLSTSNYYFNIDNRDFDSSTSPEESIIEESELNYSSGINDFGSRMDLEFQPSTAHYFRFGGSFTRHKFSPGAFAYSSNFEADTTLENNPVFSNEFSMYLEDDLKINNKLKINLGLHYSGFAVDNELYTSLEPRFSFRYLLPHDVALKGSYTLMSQYINLLTNSGLGLPTDLWVPSTGKVPPQKARQFALGLAKSFPLFDASIEGYYKKMENLIEYKEGASYVSTNNEWENKIVSGEGESYGAELFLQKKYGRWNGWLGYTISWNNRQFENLNFGREFPYRYDRRHDVNFVAIYTPKEGLELSLGWVYGTGNSVTLPTNKYTAIRNPDGYPHFDVEFLGERNGYRMAAYHRLDLSASWTKPTKWGERTWSLGLYNTYNRRNPFYVDIKSSTRFNPETKQNERVKKFEQLSLFPILPAISFSFKF